ncbi:hypothetical protein Tco_0666685 [Tanacetum coccineum]
MDENGIVIKNKARLVAQGYNQQKVIDNEESFPPVARLYQANPKESHLVVVKRIFSAKKQSSVAMSSAEAEYVDAVGCCAQVLWIKSHLADYDVLYDKVPIFCDNTSAIAISNNLVLQSRTKHIDIRYYFIRNHILKGDIELHLIPTDLQLANIFTKPQVEPNFTRLVVELDCSDECVPVPPKETVKDGLETLGLVDKDHPSLSSFALINSSPVKVKYFSPTWKVLMQYKCLGGMQRSQDQMNANQQTIAYCLCWGLNIDIADILFSDLIAHLHPEGSKNQRKPNVCYTRYLSLIMEHLLQDITAASFQKPLASEVPLTSHMLKVAKLSEEPEQSLIPPFGEVNADDTADKSLSRAFV